MRYKTIFKPTDPDSPTPSFTISERESDEYINYNYTDRLDLIANRYYGNPEYWWLILAANEYHCEFDIELGDVIRIPLPLVDVIREIRAQV